LTREGPNAWRPSYIGSGMMPERAQAIAQTNYQRLPALSFSFGDAAQKNSCHAYARGAQTLC
jgi:hypothetical protein